MMNKSKLFAISCAVIVILQALTILGSWMVSAVLPSLGVKSLLGNDGIRWLLSSFADNVCSPYFFWFLLFAMDYGSFQYMGSKDFKSLVRFGDFRDRFAGSVFFFEILLGAAICFLLAFVPHSLALGVSGKLFPGPFLSISVFVMLTTCLAANITFLFLSGRLRTFEEFEKVMSLGIQSFVPLIVMYLLLKELVETLLFVLS